jgi:hypothetical protein
MPAGSAFAITARRLFHTHDRRWLRIVPRCCSEAVQTHDLRACCTLPPTAPNPPF